VKNAPCIVKLWLGKSENQKRELAKRITKDVMDVLNYGEESVSVAMEEITARDWLGAGPPAYQVTKAATR
jgi:phenylpyruvate tautomerase PptA (4-oxalocrotonate tautomerase family)